ncbi:hypothetical protein GH733_010041 [Mirounga leonina]|nr:hypothetical protein GH733_010041 [Mirounga leonina]
MHDSVVMVTQESDSSFLVKVGFLKILHRYEITFTLPPVLRLSKDVQEAPVPSLHLKLLSVMPIPEGVSPALLQQGLDVRGGPIPQALLLDRSPWAHTLGPCVCITCEELALGLQPSLLPALKKNLPEPPPRNRYSVKCEYSAHKEGVLKEEMLLACEGGAGTCVRVTVQARVMDRHHGTPMLLDGVKCVGAELEYDSEHSDWHGFD